MSDTESTDNNQPQPPTLLQQVIQENQGLRTILGTLLQRNNDVLILRRQDRVRYVEAVNDPCKLVPEIKVESITGLRKGSDGVCQPFETGDLRVSLDWVRRGTGPTVQPPIQQPHPPTDEIVQYLGEADVTVEAGDVDKWNLGQKVAALQWGSAKALYDKGVEIEVPPRPDFLPVPSLIIIP